jgi:hypothetical protein
MNSKVKLSMHAPEDAVGTLTSFRIRLPMILKKHIFPSDAHKYVHAQTERYHNNEFYRLLQQLSSNFHATTAATFDRSVRLKQLYQKADQHQHRSQQMRTHRRASSVTITSADTPVHLNTLHVSS